jgi:hypothetical protein
MGLPHHDQSISVICRSYTVTELLLDDCIVVSDLETLEDVSKLILALRTFNRGIGHVMSHVVDVGRYTHQLV